MNIKELYSKGDLKKELDNLFEKLNFEGIIKTYIITEDENDNIINGEFSFNNEDYSPHQIYFNPENFTDKNDMNIEVILKTPEGSELSFYTNTIEELEELLKKQKQFYIGEDSY